MAGLSLIKTKLEEYKADANEALCFKLVKTITHEVLWMTQCTVARGRRPRATVHRVIHSTEGVIVLTVAQKVKTITHEVLWMTQCTVARGRRPRATVHRVIHSTEGVIVLTVAQKVRKESDIEGKDNVFHPDMTHQVFGDHESIFGYKDLEIQMYYSAARLSTYINMTSSDKVSPERFDGVEADDVMRTIAKQIPPGFYTNLDDFSVSLAKEANFKPFGELLHSYSVFKKGEERQFEIYKTDIEQPGFREYHERLQTFILFYIDAASYIDVDDERWSFYLLFEKCKYNGNPGFAIAGYMTVYNYYAYPSRIRPRISQVLILPPFQRQGHGVELLQTFYNTCYGNSDILDITVEDPSENFQRLRDFVDARNCMKLKSFKPASLLDGYDDDMSWEAREKYKINRRQARRIYEILRLKATDSSKKEQFRQYRLDIKRRLNIPFQKNGRDFEKLGKALNSDELKATLGCMTLDQRHMYLENEFEEHLKMYNHVVDRLVAAT